jgi:hypothetical protein
VGPRTGLDDVESRKILPLPGLELRPSYRPTRSQSLYQLSSPGPFKESSLDNEPPKVGNMTIVDLVQNPCSGIQD